MAQEKDDRELVGQKRFDQWQLMLQDILYGEITLLKDAIKTGSNNNNKYGPQYSGN
jgi:hypothetical protein